VQRAMALAIGHAALAAPRGLLGGFFGGVLAVNLMEILGAQIGRALFRHLAGNSDEAEHPFFGHNSASLAVVTKKVLILRCLGK